MRFLSNENQIGRTITNVSNSNGSDNSNSSRPSWKIQTPIGMRVRSLKIKRKEKIENKSNNNGNIRNSHKLAPKFLNCIFIHNFIRNFDGASIPTCFVSHIKCLFTVTKKSCTKNDIQCTDLFYFIFVFFLFTFNFSVIDESEYISMNLIYSNDDILEYSNFVLFMRFFFLFFSLPNRIAYAYEKAMMNWLHIK